MVTVLACSLAAGAVDDTPERVIPALWIFGIGLFVLVAHTGVLEIFERSGPVARTNGLDGI